MTIIKEIRGVAIQRFLPSGMDLMAWLDNIEAKRHKAVIRYQKDNPCDSTCMVISVDDVDVCFVNADDKRFERWRKRRDGEGYIRTVISLEEISMDHIENSLAMQDDSSNAEEMLVAKDGAQAFSRDYEQALKSLSESLQAAWVLFVDRNLSIGEIADYLNLPYETVKKRLQRARKTLQKILQGYCPQDVPD